MPGKTEKIIIGKNGQARGIHGPLVAAITQKLGDVTIMRASHVEPLGELSQRALRILSKDPLRASLVEFFSSHAEGMPEGWPGGFVTKPANMTKWFADMSPVAEGIVLGPFDDRETALREEVKWLEAHNIPVCHPCRGT